MGVNKNTIRIYWQQIRRYKVSFFVALVAVPASALLLDMFLPYFLSQAIGGLTMRDQALVTASLVFAAAVGTAGALLNLVGFQALSRHEANVMAGLSGSVFRSLIGKDMSFFVNEKVGALTSRYIDFVRSHIALQDLLIVRTLGFAFALGAGLIIVAFNSLMLAGIIGALIFLILVQVRLSMRIRAPYRHKRKEMIGEIHGKVADALTNNLIVKTFASEKAEVKRVAANHSEFRQVYMKDIGFLSYEGSLRVAVMAVTQLVAVAVCAPLVFNGQMSIAIAVFTLTYLQSIASQLFTLGEMINGYDKAFLEAAPMSEILARDVEIIDKKGAKSLRVVSPEVSFKDVSYRYSDGAQDVLKDISLRIAPGEKIGLVGHSGAGKTTITHLLLRFADITKGSISIGGHDVRDVTQESLRRHIAYVPQEPMLFHRSLRENIAYGKPRATDAQIRLAAKQANALEFINKLPSGLDTLVGERGVKLSGGQRQRIAIARAILKDAPILVLDEATSALDSHSERLIQDALNKLMAERTSIVIAHRLSTIARLDRIVVLDKGRIIEQGTHTELLAKAGVYANLWAHQSGGFIEE